MKATLEFNLPEDQLEYNRVNQSLDMAYALFDILQLKKSLERKFEYINNTHNDVFDGIEAMGECIYKVLEEHGIDINKLIQ
jgi:hypothetical protein